METRLLRSREILNRFLDRWPLEKVRRLSLDQYTDTGNPDTFSRWVESETDDLGGIRGYPAIKFGIYKRGDKDEIPENYASDNIYSWQKSYSDIRTEAFQAVKKDIITIIEAAQSGTYSDIDNVHLNHLVRWKIAFLYSNEQLVPIFKKDVLWAIAEAQGMKGANEYSFSEVQLFVFKNKPDYKNIYQYAADLYKEYGEEEDLETAYYLIGSKYEEGNDYDMFPLMEEYSVVCTGFAWEHDLAHLYRGLDRDIVEELKKKGEPSKSYNALRQFLQLKPGDIVAVKSTGSPKSGNPFLEIVAYAVVVERDGEVYWHESENLGHCINVQYIKTGLSRQFPLGGYGRTIHNITDPNIVDILFQNYKNGTSGSIRQKIKARRRTRQAVKSKNVTGQRRKGSQPYVTNPKHNQIQQLFKEHLEAEFGVENVFLEENNVDIKLLESNSITFYEVKPYDFAEDCIRSGLGQLLSYMFFDTDERKKKIRIVGPYPPDEDEKKFILFLQESLSIDFNYESFEID